MAEIRAFRAFRYDLGRVGNLSDVIAPPYDVIDPALQDASTPQPLQRDPPDPQRELPTDTEHDNRYTRRQALRDGRPTMYSSRTRPAQSRLPPGFRGRRRADTRKGFLTRVRLEPFGTGRIYPHEQTLAGPKADRLRLFRATAMNLSPVFGLYPDPDGAVTHAGKRRWPALPLQATDHLGVVSKLWPISDQHAISSVTGDSARSRCSSPTAITATRPVCVTWRSAPAGDVRDDEDARQLHPDDAGEHERSRPAHPADPPPGVRPARAAGRAVTEILSSQFQVERMARGEAAPATPGT